MVTLTYGVLPPILAAFQSDHRQVQLDLHVAHPNECIEMVEARQVDFAVTAVDAVASRLNVERLFREPFELVCGSEHPLASLHRVSVHHLTAYPFVHYKRGTMTRRLIDAAVHPAQIQVANEVEHVHTIRALVESGGGIGVIPAGMRSHFAGSRVVVKPIEGCALWRDIALVSHPARPLPPAAMCLASLIRREIGTSTNHIEASNLENESRSSES
jgi:LysR family carnitine catabolism transcriptional activator